MEIHEYQAKALFEKAGIKILNSYRAKSADEAFMAVKDCKATAGWIVKAQVHAGGRGLGGGIKKAKTVSQVREVTDKMIGHRLVTAQTGKEGKIIHQVLIEEMAQIKKEFYLAFLLDRAEQQIQLIASEEGGMSIEEVAHTHPEKILKISLNPLLGILSFQVLEVLKVFNLSMDFFKPLHQLLQRFYDLFLQKDATLLEINPLILTSDQQFVPLDAKMNFDDNALFRQKEITDLRDLKQLPFEERKAVTHGLSFVKMSGNIGCLVNGAGLAMATMDIVQLKGAFPANFLDVGGGVDDEKIDIAFQILKEDPNVKGILVNIFGGIVKCDLIAQGLIKAVKQLNIQIPVVVRLEGTHSQKAFEILDNSNLDVNFAKDLSSATEKIIKLVN